jgi:outer membrane immunogenic protein
MTLTKLLRTSAAALGALAVASTGANAADMYAGGGLKEAPAYIPPPLWTGFYIGAHIGAAWENFSFNRHEFSDCGNQCTWTDSGGNVWVDNPAFMNPNNQSQADAFGGGQFGYNWQWTPQFVLGIEVDLGGMALNGNGRARGNTLVTENGYYVGGTPLAFDGESQGGFYGDVTGRLGWTWGAAMIYAKGGFAWLEANMNMRESVFDSGQYGSWLCGGPGWCDFNHNNNTSLTGYTIGGGVEWKVSPAWSIKAEYLHFDFTNFNNNCCNDLWGNNFNNHADLQVDTVKLGFNYFWNPAAPAPLK